MDTTLNCPDETASASTFCAAARPAIHMTSNNMVIDTLVTMTLSLTMPDALLTETSTVPQDGKRRRRSVRICPTLPRQGPCPVSAY